MLPTPAPVESPAIIDPRLILPSINSFVSSTDDAQFGISPIMLAINGWNIDPESINFSNVSIPI